MPRQRQVAFEFGHRLTFRVPIPKSTDTVHVDVYPLHPPIQPTNPNPLHPLPWVLYLADAERQTVPEWLYTLCKSRGWPLVALDYAHDHQNAVLSDLLDGGKDSVLNWSLLATGPGAAADTGDDALDERFYFEFVPHGGLDFHRLAVVFKGQEQLEAVKSIWPAAGGGSLPPPAVGLFLTNPQGIHLDASAPWLHSIADPVIAPEAEQAGNASRASSRLTQALSYRAGKANL